MSQQNQLSDRCFRLPSDHSFTWLDWIITPRLISIVAVLVALLLWSAITAWGWISPLFLPAPSAVWAALGEILHQGYKDQSLGSHILASLTRLFWALVLTVVTAVPLGLLSGCYKPIQAMLDPFIEFYRPLPPLAYYTLLVIWLGIDDPSKIALLYLAGFAPLYLTIVSGVQRVPPARVHAARSLGASSWQVLIQVIFPSCLPDLFLGLRTAIGFMYTTLVAAEMVAAVSGLGWMVLDASKFLRSDVIFVGILLMGSLAILLDWGIRCLQYSHLPWMGKDN